jgi:solute carrier family 35 protein E2
MLNLTKNTIVLTNPLYLKIKKKLRYNSKLKIKNKIYNNIKISDIKTKKNILNTSLKWFGWSIVYNIYNKKAVMDIDTSVVTSIQIIISASITFIYSIYNRQNIQFFYKISNPCLYILAFIFVSLGQWYGNHFGNMATQLMSISSVSIIKSSEPIISMILMYILFRSSIKLYKICLIIPIIFGIILCNITDISYNHYGAILCILSNICHIIKVIISRKYFNDILKYEGYQLLLLSSIGSFLISLPIIYSNRAILINASDTSILYILISGISYHLNSVAAFHIVTKVSTVTYSIFNIYKRVAIVMTHYIINLETPSIMTIFGIISSNIGLYYYLK